jgi:hypothetical protein
LDWRATSAPELREDRRSTWFLLRVLQIVSNCELFDGTNSRIYLRCDCHLPLNEREKLSGEGLRPLRRGASSGFDLKSESDVVWSSQVKYEKRHSEIE